MTMVRSMFDSVSEGQGRFIDLKRDTNELKSTTGQRGINADKVRLHAEILYDKFPR